MTAIVRLEGFQLEASIDEPVVNAFGSIHARAALLVRIEDADGAHGWGEVFANFPPGGATHRLQLLERLVGRWYLGRPADAPEAVQAEAERAFRRLAIQCGEPGPIAQLIAGIDCALWDLGARRAAVPLAVHLGAATLAPMRAYASGINPGAPERVVDRARRERFRAFKLKLGFADDERNLDVLEGDLQTDEELFVDLNQAWEPDVAGARLPALGRRRLGWIEEPMPADQPSSAFAALQAICPVPIAGGENVAGDAAFAAAIAEGAFRIVQPDVVKWGGLSGCRRVARHALSAGLRYCPHYLGGGVGLLHSAALLNAVGGDGLLEIDANPNPLRDRLVPLPRLDDAGYFRPLAGPGIGVEPAMSPWLQARCDVH